MIEHAVEELTPIVGTRPACRALGAAPATIYRHRNPPAPQRKRAKSPSARALSGEERKAVLEELHSERFVDCSPAQTWATLLDEGRYLASERTMYRLLAAEGETRERRNQLAHLPRLRSVPSMMARYGGLRGVGHARENYRPEVGHARENHAHCLGHTHEKLTSRLGHTHGNGWGLPVENDSAHISHLTTQH